MGVILETYTRPNLNRYNPEYNDDGIERHIICNGARFHVVSWDSKGEKCSEPNCEINKRRNDAL